MRRPLRERLTAALTNIVLLIAFAFGAMLLVPTALGMHHYVILTGSMTGTYDRGSIVFDRPVPTAGLRVGDVITYSPPPGQTAHSQVTHRIHRLRHGRDGLRIYQTKGDANLVQDPWTFQLPQPTQDKVVFSVPYAGFGLGVISDRHYRMFLVGIPALLVALSVLRGLWRDSSEQARLNTPGWGDIGELAHDADPIPAGDIDAAAVFVALAYPATAPAGGRTAATRRPVVARGPLVPELQVPRLH
jgi:signal peptidase